MLLFFRILCILYVGHDLVKCRSVVVVLGGCGGSAFYLILFLV